MSMKEFSPGERIRAADFNDNFSFIASAVADKAPLLFTENVQTGNYTLALSDVAKVVAINSGSAATVTVPSDSSVAFPVGTFINVYRAGTGDVEIEGAVGVTVRNTGSISDQYGEVSLRKRDTDEWVLVGQVDEPLIFETQPFVESYLARTGGEPYLLDGGGSINAALDAASAGDAIVLRPGVWSVDQLPPGGPSQGLFRAKNVLIAGTELNPADVILNYDPDGSGVDIRDSPLGGYAVANNSWQMGAFLNIRRFASIAQLNTNYALSLTKADNGAKFSFVNCVIRLGGRGVSWNYDNTNILGQVRFTRCTFAEYSSWLSNYSGSSAKILVNSPVYSGGRNSGATFSGTERLNQSISLPSGAYDTTANPVSGHLYLPPNALTPTFF